MTDIEAAASLLNQPLPKKLTKAGTPELSDLMQARIIEQANKPQYVGDTRLPYMTYDDLAAADDIYDPTDFHTVGNLIRNNVAKAITERFPVVGDKYTLKIENLAYEKPKNRRLADEKAILQQEKSLMDRLRGDWVLIDNTTGKEIERKSATILNVPRMTARGTFIRNGSELGLKHMFRLKPGIYARVKGDGTPSVHINPAQTTGRQMSLNMDQTTGVMAISRGTRTYGVMPLLRAAGVSDDEMKAAWGAELFEIQKNKYARILANSDQMSEYKKLWEDGFKAIKLDPDTTLSTMGKAYKEMSPEVLLGAANKAVKLSRSMSVEDEDDRDSLAYQRIMGPADYIPERIVRDGGGLLRKMFQRVVREGSLKSIESGAFQPQVDSVFLEDKHAGYIDGASPFEGLDFASGVSRIGEGGIGDIKAAPAETRGVNDSYLGFIDPIRSVESLKVGLEVYMTYGVKKDSKGNLYANFIDKSGNTALRPMGVVAKSIVATPEYYDPSADPEEFIPAFNGGKGIEYTKRKDVDFFLANSNNMMSVGAGMIPNIGGIRSNRTLMGCLHPATHIVITRNDETINTYAGELLDLFKPGDKVLGIKETETEQVIKNLDIRQVVKVTDNTQTFEVSVFTGTDTLTAKVSDNHKWHVKHSSGREELITTAEIKTESVDGLADVDYIPAFVFGEDGKATPIWCPVASVTKADDPGYLVDIDVDDNLYVLGNGMVTHNSKYPLQALSLKYREAPLVQRQLTADGEDSTTERRVAKQLGAKFSPVDGRVISITDDEMVIRDREGTKHTVDLYNMYPANQKGYLHNTPSVQVGDRVKANQLIAESNYTKGDSAALGTNLKVAYISGHGAEAFEDAIAISESASKKLASEQLHKFRGDLSSDTAYDKQRFLSLFGDNDYSQEQLDKIDENGMPKVGVEFKKGDPVFLGIQIRDLSTSGLARNATVPYVKTWEHDAPGKVIDVVKGRKHMTVYTRSFTPMQLGDKLCFDEQTEIMTKRGWILFKDLLVDDEVLTLDIRTGDNFFSAYESAFKYYCEKETMYRLTSKRLDIFTTIAHKHVVAPMNNGRYLALQSSEQVFGKHRWFPTSCNIERDSSFASNREDGAKERWEKYTGWVYCVTVPHTHTVFVRRNGKTVWSGNSARYGNKGTISCYDSSTYVFTFNGFRPFSELTVNDKVAVLDPATGKAHFEHPKAVQHSEYRGTMYGYQDRNLSWLVTPTHDMWAAIPSCGECKRINIKQVHGKLFGVCITPPEKLGKTVSHQLSGLTNVITNPNNFFTEEYDGTIHCCTVSTGIIYVMRDGKPMWCGNSIIPDNEMYRDENGEPYDIIQSPLGLPSRCYDDQTEFLTRSRGWQFGKDVLDTDELYCFDPATFTGRFDKQIDKFYKAEYNGKMYGVVNADVDFLVTAGHKVYVSHGDENFTECLVEDCYDRYCEFPAISPEAAYRVVAAFAMEWFTTPYKGMVYCPSVTTGYVLTRRNGRQICLGNTNPAQLGELHLSKVAKLTGKPVSVPDFIVDDTIDSYVGKQLKKYGLKPTSRIFDPRSNKYIDDVEDGYLYYYKLKHMSELKERGRGTGTYSGEEVPMKGAGAARRLGMMETSAVYSGGGMDVLKDAKLIRGQRNDEFWRKYRNGETPDIPGTPLVHKKFFSHLVASGANIERTIDGGFKLSAATDDDIKELTGNRRVSAAATFDSKNMHPIDGGLFDPVIFGDEGDRWGYYELPEPVLNPLMFKPVASILGWTDKELREYLQGARKVDNEFGPESLMKRLDGINLESELQKAKDVLKSGRATLQQRDLARKRIRAIHPMIQEGIKPSQLFFTRMPILPPRFRAVTVINGGDTNISADANFLYKRMIDAADDLNEAKGNLPEEFQVDARESLYNAVNAVVGLMPTDDPKLEAKGVSGLLKWAFGKGSPKGSAVQRKVFGSNLDMGGLGTIIPNSNLTIDQVGIPEESAWSMYEPFVVRELRQNGYSMVQAMREVLDRSDDAKRELLRVMSRRPILMNRAPTLWRYGIQGFYPVIVPGRAIQTNPNIMKTMAGDYDGDSVTTHVPVSYDAIQNIDKSMLPSRNLLSPKDFKAHFIPRDASNEGLFLATRVAPGKPVRFRTEAEAQAAYDRGEIKIDTPIEIG